MNKMEEVKIVVDGLRNGMFENYSDLDEAVLPHFEYLLSIIEHAEKSLEKISKNAYLDHLGDVSLLMLQMSGNIADEALKAIRGN